MTTESQARRVAQRYGTLLRKSRKPISPDSSGGYMIVDSGLHCVVAGSRFELSAEDVVAWFEHRQQPGAK